MPSSTKTYVTIDGKMVVCDDTSSTPHGNEPVDPTALMNRQERRHGKDWKVPELRKEWKRRDR